MIKQECIGIPDMIPLSMIFLFKDLLHLKHILKQKLKIKAEIVLSPGGAYFWKGFSIILFYLLFNTWDKAISQRLGIIFLVVHFLQIKLISGEPAN